MPEPSVSAIPRLYIVSDLHLAEGLDPRTLRYGRLEGFFYDEEFGSFLDACLDETGAEPAVLILNGDVFDFLSCTRIPSPPERRDLGFEITSFERKYGLSSTEQKAVWKLEQMMHGHRGFFVALVRWMARGQRLVLIRGNHDLELFWPAVQARLIEHFRALAAELPGGPTPDELAERFAFRDWFYHEPGRVFVEHGHQYEESNCVPNLLHPVSPQDPGGGREPALEYPVGSWFLEIVFNRLRVIDPIRTKIITGEEYGQMVTRARFLDFAFALWQNLPFLMRMVRDFQPFEQAGARHVRGLHQEGVHALAAETGLADKLWLVDGLKARGSGDTTYMVGARLLMPVLWKVFLGLLAVVFGVGAYTGIHTWLAQGGGVLSGPWRVVLSALVGAGAFLGAAFLVVYVARHQRDEGMAHAHQFRDAAMRVARAIGVKVVVMGHTHLADYHHAPGANVTYLNSGTWTFVRTPENIIKPNAHSFTFVRVTGDRAELLRWSDAAERFERVVLLTPDRPRMVERLMGRRS